MIEVNNLVKRYGNHIVLDHLSFIVQPGQIYGFLGPNGAGKSTTMNILTGYIGMTEGTVLINGHDISEESDDARKALGYLPELPPLYADMTPREYLDFAAELKGLPKSSRKDEVIKVMELTGIAHVQDRLIANLSKGYRQRVGLAQAILGFPEIIILDEPTVGLDPQQIIEVRDLIRSLAGNHTVILSSHILSEVQEICDHILILHHGKLIADGTPEELEQRFRDNSLELILKASDEKEALSVLENIPGADICKTQTAGNECLIFIRPEDPSEDLRETVFRACAAADIPLLGMKQSIASLEDVFLKLVSDNVEPALDSTAGKSIMESDNHPSSEAIPDESAATQTEEGGQEK